VGGGAWPFLVGGVICLVNSDNERDLNLLNSQTCIQKHTKRSIAKLQRSTNEHKHIQSNSSKASKIGFQPDINRKSQLEVECQGVSMDLTTKVIRRPS
jgi:hypothetical protein